jgi:hypothetical protein
MRVFKTTWFNKAAKKARIKDSELCKAIEQVLKGQVTDLGGGVFKKRLNENRHRSIILSKSELFWVYEFLFAKKDMDNIDDHELAKFRQLANAYTKLSEEQVNSLVQNKSLVEICNENKTQI